MGNEAALLVKEVVVHASVAPVYDAGMGDAGKIPKRQQVEAPEVGGCVGSAAARHGKGAFRAGWLKSLMLVLGLLVSSSLVRAQERTMMPVSVDGEQVRLAVTTYKPPGAGPFPTLIFHHGSTGRGTDPSRFSRTFDPGVLAYWFVSRGWAVVLPSRRGRGGSEGLYDEGFAADRANGYTCDPARTLTGADRALNDIDAITDAVLALPFVDRTRFVVGGNSRGGILSVAWAGKHPDEPRGVINFVGGWLGAGCPTSSAVNQQLFNRVLRFRAPRFGSTVTTIPIIH